MSANGNGTIRIALAGQPNVGKSTVFNLLTGLSQHVGNWPGKTVEQKSGICHYEDWTFDVIDLPGTYSLSANSPEELIAREYIIREKPDVLVAILNAATLERSLYLVSELMPLSVPMVIGLNMIDVAEQSGLQIEPHVLEAALGVPVVPLVAAKGKGIKELLSQVRDVICNSAAYTANAPDIRADHKDILDQVQILLADKIPPEYPPTWVALKLLEGDQQIREMMHPRLDPQVWEQVLAILKEHEDACVAVASGRYEWVARMVRAAVVRPKTGQITLTDRLDRWVTHSTWGLCILGLILALAFWLTYTIGSPLTRLMSDYVVQNVAAWAARALSAAPHFLASLLVDGVIGGVGTVLTFMPILVIFFAVLAILEDVGYMARGAFVMDRFMHLMGLHGKSFLPLFLGFGCNVPAVMGSRVIESERARLLTVLLAPLVPCSGRMAVLAFLVPVFFASPTLVSWALLTVNLVVLALAGWAMNKAILRGKPAAFIMELPLYHLPNWRTIGLTVWQWSVSFVRKAGTVILVASVVIWALSSYPAGDIENSLLGRFGQMLEPVGGLMGLDWRMMLALLSGFVAKENVVATLGVLFGGQVQGVGLTTVLRNALSPAAALAFLVLQMLFIPCVATVGAIRQETNSWRWTAFSVLLLLLISLAGGMVAYNTGRMLGW